MKPLKLFLTLLPALALLAGALLIAPEAARQGVVRQIGVFEFTARDAQGNVLWTEEAHNSLADEGEQHLLDVTLRNGTAATQFFVRLSDTTTPCSIAETNNLTAASAGEPSTNGYAAQLVERSAVGWPTLALDAGDFMATSSTETFTATGGSWGPVFCAFLATTSDNTGRLISFAALSTGRTLASGETLQVTYRLKLQ